MIDFDPKAFIDKISAFRYSRNVQKHACIFSRIPFFLVSSIATGFLDDGLLNRRHWVYRPSCPLKFRKDREQRN